MFELIGYIIGICYDCKFITTSPYTIKNCKGCNKPLKIKSYYTSSEPREGLSNGVFHKPLKEK